MKKKIRDADPSAFLQGLSEITNPKSRERKDLKGSEMSCIDEYRGKVVTSVFLPNGQFFW